MHQAFGSHPVWVPWGVLVCVWGCPYHRKLEAVRRGRTQDWGTGVGSREEGCVRPLGPPRLGALGHPGVCAGAPHQNLEAISRRRAQGWGVVSMPPWVGAEGLGPEPG